MQYIILEYNKAKELSQWLGEHFISTIIWILAAVSVDHEEPIRHQPLMNYTKLHAQLSQIPSTHVKGGVISEVDELEFLQSPVYIIDK